MRKKKKKKKKKKKNNKKTKQKKKKQKKTKTQHIFKRKRVGKYMIDIYHIPYQPISARDSHMPEGRRPEGIYGNRGLIWGMIWKIPKDKLYFIHYIMTLRNHIK